MPLLIVVLIGVGTVAFGGVYPWGYIPLFSVAASIGIIGLWRCGLPHHLRPLAWALAVLWIAAALQLAPLPRAVVDAISPSTAAVSGAYNLAASSAMEPLPLSIAPAQTRIAVVALAALAVYLVGLASLLKGDAVRSLPRMLAICAVPLALFAIYTRTHISDVMYGFWRPLDGNASNSAGPFINRNHFGGWMLMSLCVMVGSVLGRIERAASARQRSMARALSSRDAAMLPMMAAVLISAVSLFWSMSRSAISSFAVAAALFAYLVHRRHHLGTRPRVAAFATLGVVLLAGIWWRGPTVLVDWFLDDRSFLSRMDAWRDGWDVIRAFPLAGTGLNTFSAAMLFYQQRNPDFHMAQAHNDYVQLLAEGGLLISVPAAVAAGLLARAVLHTLRRVNGEISGYWIRAGAAVGLLAMAVQELVEFSLQIPANALLFCTLAALATAASARCGAPRGGARTRATISVSKEPGAALS